MRVIHRRSFLKRALAAGTAAAMSPACKVLGSQRRYSGRGRGLPRPRQGSPAQLPEDGGRPRGGAVRRRPGHSRRGSEPLRQRGQKVDAYRDIRKLLERKDIDAVSLVTPNHWHALGTVWACQAGKDVCVEKPVSHNIWEGRKMVQAARKYGRMVQADLDERSRSFNDRAFEYLHSGALGKILVVRGFLLQASPRHRQDQRPGAHPRDRGLRSVVRPGRPRVPSTAASCTTTGTGSGTPAAASWATTGPISWTTSAGCFASRGMPRRVMSVGGRFGVDDAGQTPNTQLVFCDYPTAPVIYEVRGLPDKPGSQDDGHLLGHRRRPAWRSAIGGTAGGPTAA